MSNRSFAIFIAWLLALLAFLAFGPRACAQGLRTNKFMLVWDPHPEWMNLLAHNLYVATNLPAPASTNLSQTNWIPSESERGSIWKWHMVIPTVDTNGNRLQVTNCWVTNIWSGASPPRAVFMTLTASNHLGESPFSNVAWVPAAPLATNKLTLQLVE